MEGYEKLKGLVTPAYSFVEGDARESYWVDSQNCFYHLIIEDTDEETDLRIDGKKYWIIEPYKPIGTIITKENYKELESSIKWLVTFTSEEGDEGKEWDFEEHKIKD